MHSEAEMNVSTGLLISDFRSDNIYPLLPLLSQEFPKWSMDRIKNYVKLVVSKEKISSTGYNVKIGRASCRERV